MEGFIKDHRQELFSDVWQMPPLYHRLWQWLKYQVNHKDAEVPMRDGSKFLVKRGQHLTSVRKIAIGIGWYERGLWKEPNPKTVTEILKWFEKQNMISVDNGNGKYTLVTLINWGLYQKRDDESNAKVTVDGEVSIQSLGTNKNEKNVKNDKNDKELIISYWSSKNLSRPRKITPHIMKQVTWKLSDYTAEELISCIDAYERILNDPEYKLDTRWSLIDFLEKEHFQKFLPDRDPYSFYPKVGGDRDAITERGAGGIRHGSDSSASGKGESEYAFLARPGRS